jgi:phosphoglycolate phosphatase-like HAD superfamily hydrolase
VAPERGIYIGDEVRDIVAAHAAGMHAIAYGGAVRGDPEAATAAAFATDWTEVADAVRRITEH